MTDEIKKILKNSKVLLSVEDSFEIKKRINEEMKEFTRDFKYRQAKSIETAKKLYV